MKCLECDKDLITKNSKKFCNTSHAAAYNNRNRVKKVSDLPQCYGCEESVKTKQSLYCSQSCMAKHKKEKCIEDWYSGQYSGSLVNGSLAKPIRNHLIEKANFKCTSPTCCVPGGWSVPNPVLGYAILTVDHIDGNWSNNRPENLVVLCYNCHTLTETFGSLNAGSESGSKTKLNRVYVEKETKICIEQDCQEEILVTSERCKSCHSKTRYGIKWPPDEELILMVKENSFTKVGRIIGCSGSAVSKRYKSIERL